MDIVHCVSENKLKKTVVVFSHDYPYKNLGLIKF